MKVTVILVWIDSLGTIPERLIKGKENLEISEQVETNQIYIIININQSSEKSSGELRRLIFSQTSVRNYLMVLL